MIGQASRRAFLTGAGTSVLAGCVHASGLPRTRPALAVTIDDFDVAHGPLLSAEQRHRAVLGALERHRIRACGFPKGSAVEQPDARRRLGAWAEQGHGVGCHSYAHRYYSGADPAAFAADLARALPLVSGLRTSVPLFRFPFLAEGRTREGRDAARRVLAAQGLANGHVTIDTSDWVVAQRLTARLKGDARADLGPYRRFYIRHLLDRASFYDQLARDVLGRAVPHTLLLHHNLATALFLGAALDSFKAAGWRLIDASEAFADPMFRSEPDIAPAGQSLVWQLAKAKGGFEPRLRYPGEDERYEQPLLDQLGL